MGSPCPPEPPCPREDQQEPRPNRGVACAKTPGACPPTPTLTQAISSCHAGIFFTQCNTARVLDPRNQQAPEQAPVFPNAIHSGCLLVGRKRRKYYYSKCLSLGGTNKPPAVFPRAGWVLARVLVRATNKHPGRFTFGKVGACSGHQQAPRLYCMR